MRGLISDAQKKEFRDNGVVFIEHALDAEALRLAQAAFDWSLEHPSPMAANYPSKDDAAATFYQDLANPNAVAAYRHMLEDSPAADIAAAIWGTPDVWFMYEQVFLKQGGKSRRTPWHQDSSYLPVDGEQLAVMWIPFEHLKKENSLELVRGSHRGTLYNGSRFDLVDDTAPIYPEETLPRLPNIEAHRGGWDIVSWAIAPGDILVFHPAMLHGGAPTLPSQRRRTLSLRFFGHDAVYAPRMAGGLTPAELPREDAGDSSEPVFRKLPRSLAPGDPFRHPDFLKVRPRSSNGQRNS